MHSAPDARRLAHGCRAAGRGSHSRKRHGDQLRSRTRQCERAGEIEGRESDAAGATRHRRRRQQLYDLAPASRWPSTRRLAHHCGSGVYEGPADRADLYFAGESFPGYYRLFPRVSLVAVNSSVAERRRRWRNVAMSSGSARIGDLSLRAL